MNISDIRDRATISVPEAGELLGIGRDRAYKAVREGQIPSLRLGNRILVPVPRLLRQLGQTEEQQHTREQTRGMTLAEFIGFQLEVSRARATRYEQLLAQMGVDQQMEKLRQDLRDIPPGVKVRPRVIDTPDDDER